MQGAFLAPMPDYAAVAESLLDGRTRDNVPLGSTVAVVQKCDQRVGNLTTGKVHSRRRILFCWDYAG